MKRFMILIMIGLFLLPTVLAPTETICVGNNLQINSMQTINVSGEIIDIVTTENKTCQYGCSVNKCNSPPVGLMTNEIYIFIAGMNIIFMILALFKKEIIIFGWFSVMLSFVLGISSGSIETVFCEYGSSWECAVQKYGSTPLMFMWFAFGTFMLAYSIVFTISKPLETLKEQVG